MAALAVAGNVNVLLLSRTREAAYFHTRSKNHVRSPGIVPRLKLRASAGACASQRAAINFDVFRGLEENELPIGICETYTLPAKLCLEEAMNALHLAVTDLQSNPFPFGNGVLRFQVPIPPSIKALQWLRSQPQKLPLLPRAYFSSRASTSDGSREMSMGGSYNRYYDIDARSMKAAAGVGAAVLFDGLNGFSLKDWKSVRRYLSKKSPLIKAYGGIRFNSDVKPSVEWSPFGSFYFFVPQIEYCECTSCALLAVTIVWDKSMGWPLPKAIQNSIAAMSMVSAEISFNDDRSVAQACNKDHFPDEHSWESCVKWTLDCIDSTETECGVSSFLNQKGLSKVVMARRTRLEMEDSVDPLSLLSGLQEKDPSAYQFVIQVPDGSAFIGSTPERLFARNGLLVASEAVAGTCPRGSTDLKDRQMGMDLMNSSKDHHEFEIVRESVKQHMEMVCKLVEVDLSKRLIKQARVQHLYTRFNGEICDESGEFDLLSGLHPTPAVGGHPKEMACNLIAAYENFDRGFYAGPVGWFGGDGAEFAVGIRSSLVQPWKGNSLQCTSSKFEEGSVITGKRPSDFNYCLESNGHTKPDHACKGGIQSEDKNHQKGWKSLGGQVTSVFLYSGVGIVKGAKPASEWQELDLKTSQFEALLFPSHSLEEAVNINALWASLIVEECCRLGITYFCIAPGSRSSPIAAAAAANPRVSCISCIDERSMAFLALGYGKGAQKPAAVVTSSGTAVSNLFPAVVEASQDFVPLLVLTADRPPELYDTGASQTIDQGNHFGSFVRYNFSLPAADDRVPARMVLTTLDTAVYQAMRAPAGPVHINCCFREPLAGIPESWNSGCLKGLDQWASTSNPFTQYICSRGVSTGGRAPELKPVVEILESAKNGLIVVGGLQTAEESWAVALLGQHLGWPVVPDVVSGLRFGRNFSTDNIKGNRLNIIYNFDQVLLSNSVAQSLNVDVILQIGSRLTSKRLSNFLEASNPFAHILVEEHSFRHDPSHIITHRIQSHVSEFSSKMMQASSSGAATPFCTQLQLLSEGAEREMLRRLREESSITEPFIAHYIASSLPSGCTLFLGNSMPIRDVDMYAYGSLNPLGKFKLEDNWDQVLPTWGTRVSANRGASGIDGVLSTAIGFAAGSNQRVTLLLGDLSFLHDTNGLTLLTERVGQPPVTVVVVNNKGGGIFSLLPVAHTVPAACFSALFSTPHDISLENLCLAHRVNYTLVQSKHDLDSVLHFVHQSPNNWVVEVQSSIDENAEFHRSLQCTISRAVTRAFHVFSMFSSVMHSECHNLSILEATYTHYRFSLRSPPTTRTQHKGSGESSRHGFLLWITLLDGSSGLGEITPLKGLHEENLLDVEEQLRLFVEKLKGERLPVSLLLLNGSISDWLSKVLGFEVRFFAQVSTIYPCKW